jgi:hypothetical protein
MGGGLWLGEVECPPFNIAPRLRVPYHPQVLKSSLGGAFPLGITFFVPTPPRFKPSSINLRRLLLSFCN